jgi:hypothetical protein
MCFSVGHKIGLVPNCGVINEFDGQKTLNAGDLWRSVG